MAEGAGIGTVAILAPMRSELTAVVRAGRLERDRLQRDSLGRDNGQARSAHRGRVGSADVTAVQIGMGPDRAARRARQVIDELRPDLVLVVGVAGALEPTLSIGDVVVPADVLDHATGARYTPTLLPGPVARGTVVTVPEVLTDETESSALAGNGCLIVDMEASGVGRACTDLGCRWGVVRSVSDRAQDGLVDQDIAGLSRVDGNPDVTAAIRLLLRKPGRVRDMTKLGRDLKTATTAAARAALDICARLG